MNSVRFALFALVLFNANADLSVVNAKSPENQEHGITVLAKSTDDLRELLNRLPASIGGTANSFVRQVAGPLIYAVGSQQPIGLWLDWNGDLPAAVAFIHNPKLSRFQQHLEQAGVKVKAVEPGIMEIGQRVPLYYANKDNYLLVAAAPEHLRSLQVPQNLAQHQSNALSVQVELKHIPVQVRTEVADVLARRLLPASVTLADEDTAENLLKTYVVRMLRGYADRGLRIQLSIDSTATGFQIDTLVEGPQVRRISKETSVFPDLNSLHATQLISVHTSLSDEEVAMLNWWSRSFAEKVMATFDQAEIENRNGRQALAMGAEKIAELISKTAQSGVLEGFACLVGEEQDLPVIGFKIPSGQWLDQAVRKIADVAAMEQLGIQSIEWDLESINEIKVHRFHFGSTDQQPETVAMLIAKDSVYLTDGVAGLRHLRTFLRKDPVRVAPQTFAIRCVGTEVASFLGYDEGNTSPDSELQITSEYTDTGVRFKVVYSM